MKSCRTIPLARAKSPRLRRRALVFAASSCALVGSWAVAPPLALACPDCAASRAARSLVWADRFGVNLVVTLLPLVVIVTLATMLERQHGSST